MYELKTVGLFAHGRRLLPAVSLAPTRAADLVLAPAAASLAAFAYLLTFHPSPAGRTYAAYGGVYVAVAVFWMWLAEGQKPDRWDRIGASVVPCGMALIASVRAGSSRRATWEA